MILLVAQVALPVKLDRIILPERAAVVRPEDWLEEPRRSQFLEMADFIPIEDDAPAVRACHRISPDGEIKMARRCIQCGMAVVLGPQFGLAGLCQSRPGWISGVPL